MNWGPVAGVGFATQGGFDEALFRWQAGAFFSIDPAADWRLTADLGYSLKENAYVTQNDSGIYDSWREEIKRRYHYVDLNLSFGYLPSRRLEVALGGYAGLLFQASRVGNVEFVENGNPGSFSYEQHTTGQYYVYDFGALAAVKVHLGSVVVAGLSFQQGLVNIYAVDFIPIVEKNRTLTAIIGLKLNALFSE